MGLREIKKKLDALEAERIIMAARNEDTVWLEEQIRDLQEFMHSAIEEYEAMDVDKAGGDTEKTDMDVDPKTGEKRDRNEAEPGKGDGSGLRAYVGNAGQ